MLKKELEALIQLLDDPDEVIYSQIKDKIISFGEEVIPSLEEVWEHNTFGVLFQNRIEEIIHSIQFDHVYTSLHEWAEDGAKNMMEGVLLIARYQYPDLDEDKVNEYIDQLVRDVWLEMNEHLTALEQVKVINHILFDVHRFSGNTTNYHAPKNSYINNVVESKKGNPISLSILYALVAQKLSLPIYGVNLPRHFVLAYVDKLSIPPGGSPEDGKVLFYINPFSRGGVFSHKEIDHFLKQLRLEPEPVYYSPSSNLAIAQRILNNLIHSYEKLGYPDKVADIKKLREALIFH